MGENWKVSASGVIIDLSPLPHVSRLSVVRFEKTDASYFALLCLVCAIIAWRQVFPIYE